MLDVGTIMDGLNDFVATGSCPVIDCFFQIVVFFMKPSVQDHSVEPLGPSSDTPIHVLLLV